MIVDHLGLPGNGVQHIEKEMGVHLGLQCPNLGVLDQQLLLASLLVIGVKLKQHLVKGLCPHTEFLGKKPSGGRALRFPFEISLM